ncbi:MAG: hypothetical protein N838_05665 [Thiohalocapsa sp. PB-PSB1]|nr:MAG: hypothetical protein N838_32045 [Thiohalocapsa sp. PB-PSB1]QQO52928.1 MAG: hypothetical protein N838_05665 [Thiohalocapsa sp. PB-PSB1]HCS91739.1 hypothetical protein [Chromatiaceae bacterium]
MEREFHFPGGCLRVTVSRELMPLETLIGFAARANPKRPFLFVSRVLGRHIPVRPATMRQTYRMLAKSLCDLPGPIWVIGMAETATGLGLGVADSLAEIGLRDDVYAQHTTRFDGDSPPMLRFRESHSHAPMHLVQQPRPRLRGAFDAARSLVIVDDEVSTGRSVAALANSIMAQMPSVEVVAFVNLVDWLEPERREQISRELTSRMLGRRPEIRWHSLLEGAFSFIDEQTPVDPRTLPDNVEPRVHASGVRGDLGRTGLWMPTVAHINPEAPSLADQLPAADTPVRVIGTGECAFAPFLLAEALERLGYDVYFQCVSRSPVRLGGAIQATLECQDPYGEGVGYYLHNPPPAGHACIVVLEHPLDGPVASAARQWLHLMIPTPAKAGEATIVSP